MVVSLVDVNSWGTVINEELIMLLYAPVYIIIV